jgi:hypothetical protein
MSSHFRMNPLQVSPDRQIARRVRVWGGGWQICAIGRLGRLSDGGPCSGHSRPAGEAEPP